MSKFSETVTTIRNQAYLVGALTDLGYKPEVHADAAALVTTEKDAVNLCAGFREAIAPLEVYWLKVRMTIDREAEFLRLVTAPFAVKR